MDNAEVFRAMALIIKTLKENKVSAETGLKAMQNILEAFHHMVKLPNPIHSKQTEKTLYSN